jgi:putative hydrolase of the HAD superfamily
MLAALRTIKAHYRVACITNNVKSGQGAGMATTSERASRVAEVMSEFDLVIESSELGIRKPDPRIYQHTCNLLGIEPGEALFSDGLGINLKPAKALGMRTIKVVREDQALSELSAELGLSLVD